MSSIQNISTKFESTSRQSAEVTAALAGFNTPNAVEAYDRLQAIETATVKAATAKQNAARIAEETTSAYETIRKNVRLLNAACVNICEIRGLVSAEYFTVVDRGDDAGLARRLEPEMRRVSGFGPPLADGLAHMLRDLGAAETPAAQAKASLTSSQRDLDAALLNLQGAVAQGRAVLATLGIKLSRKVKKKSEREAHRLHRAPGGVNDMTDLRRPGLPGARARRGLRPVGPERSAPRGPSGRRALEATAACSRRPRGP